MLMNKVDRTPENTARIGLDQEWEVGFWCARFSVTPETLRAAVAEVGPSTSEVERHLREAARKSFGMGGED